MNYLHARPRTRPISLRLDDDVLMPTQGRGKEEAQRVPDLLKEFVVERLYEEEKREGMLK